MYYSKCSAALSIIHNHKNKKKKKKNENSLLMVLESPCIILGLIRSLFT